MKNTNFPDGLYYLLHVFSFTHMYMYVCRQSWNNGLLRFTLEGWRKAQTCLSPLPSSGDVSPPPLKIIISICMINGFSYTKRTSSYTSENGMGRDGGSGRTCQAPQIPTSLSRVLTPKAAAQLVKIAKSCQHGMSGKYVFAMYSILCLHHLCGLHKQLGWQAVGIEVPNQWWGRKM